MAWTIMTEKPPVDRIDEPHRLRFGQSVIEPNHGKFTLRLPEDSIDCGREI